MSVLYAYAAPVEVPDDQYTSPSFTGDHTLIYPRPPAQREGLMEAIYGPRGIKAGDSLMSGPGAPFNNGNCLPLRNIPVGTVIHAIEIKIGGGAKICRAAGVSAPSWRSPAKARPQRSARGEPGTVATM